MPAMQKQVLAATGHNAVHRWIEGKCVCEVCAWRKVFGYAQKATPRKVKAYIYCRDNALCRICGKHVWFTDATIDHIIPRANGGSDKLTNLRLAHKSCNGARGARVNDGNVGKERRTGVISKLMDSGVIEPL